MKNMKRSKISISPAQRAGTIINYFVLTLLAILCLYPVWYVAVASFSDSNLLMQHNGLMLFPKGFSLSAYERVFSNPMILRGLRQHSVCIVFRSCPLYAADLLRRILPVAEKCDVPQAYHDFDRHYDVFSGRHDSHLSEYAGLSSHGNAVGTDHSLRHQHAKPYYHDHFFFQYPGQSC